VTPPERDLLTIPAAAHYLGTSARVIRQLIAAGQLAGVPAGAGVRIARPVLDAYLESTRVRPGDLRHLYERSASPG